MIDDYRTKNIDQTLESVASFNATELQQFLIYEREHKDRNGVIDGINEMLVEVEVPKTGYYKGFWFDEGGRHMVKDSARLRRTAEQTELEVVD